MTGRAWPRAAALCALGAAAVIAPGPLPAAAQTQSIQGTVVDDAEERPLEAVEVILYDSAGTARDETLTDEDGAFSLAVPDPGEWVVGTSLIGYAEFRSDPVPVVFGERVTVEVRLDVRAVPLEPLVVTDRGDHLSRVIRDFYRRARSRSSFGYFVTREDIERRRPLQATDVFRGLAAVRITYGERGNRNGLRMAGNCVPAIYVDGSEINGLSRGESLDDYVSVSDIEGVEVYRGGNSQVGAYRDRRGCGVILVWTRRGEPDGRPWSWRRLGIAGAILGLIILLN